MPATDTRFASALVTALLATLAATAVRAATPGAPVARRIVVLKSRAFDRAPGTVWEPAKGSTGRASEHLSDYLVQRLKVEPYLVVLSPTEVARALREDRIHRVGADLGLQQMRLGVDQYKELRVDDAVRSLETAQRSLLEAYHDLVAPEAVADLSLVLAQAYLELKKEGDAHVALKQMFFRSPHRRFKKGFYSPRFESALNKALTDFLATFPKQNPLISQERLEGLARALNADAVIFPYLVRGADDATEVRIVVFDRKSRNVSYRGRFISVGQNEDFERIDRFVTRWTTCLPYEGANPPKPKWVHRFYVDTSFAYNLFVDQPTRRYFHNLGVGLSGEWQFSEGLGIFVQVNMFSSTEDPDRDLIDDFTSVRTLFGLFYAFSGPFWRIQVRLGWDAHFLGSGATTTNRYCKFYGFADKDCRAGDVVQFADEILMGPNVAFGVQFFVGRDVYLSLRTSLSTYVFPADRPTVFNYPFSAELGVGYTF